MNSLILSKSKSQNETDKKQEKSLLTSTFQFAKYYLNDKLMKIKSLNLKKLEEKMTKKGVDIYILGKDFSYTSNLKEKEQNLILIKNYLTNMKKFTYSSKFSYGEQKLDDMGWGCTIRAGQMVLANLLIISQLSYQTKNPSSQILEKVFIYERNPFSIQNILQLGEQKQNKKIGEQWSQLEFFQATKIILESFAFKLPFKTQTLQKYEIYLNDGVISKDKIKQIIECDRTVILVVNFQLGRDKPAPCHKENLFKFIKSEFFKGGIIGKDNQAYYTFGIVKNNLVFLDPHKVRKCNKSENYDVSEFYSISYQDIHPNLTLSFLLKNKNNFEQFEELVKKLKWECLDIIEKDDDDSECSDDMLIDFSKNIQNIQIKKSDNKKKEVMLQFPVTAHKEQIDQFIIEENKRKESFKLMDANSFERTKYKSKGSSQRDSNILKKKLLGKNQIQKIILFKPKKELEW